MHSEASVNVASNAVSALSLSQEDIRRLLEDSSSQTRIDITNKISGAYGASALHAKELKVAEQIFRMLLRDTEVRVRASLADNIKSSKSIPRDIVMVLARDVEEVALPVLEYSEVLSEEDLVDLVKTTRSISRQLAMARRKEITQLLSNALLGTHNPQVATTLLENNGADIAEEDLEAAIEEYRENGKLMEIIGSRPQLPISTVEKLISVVSGSLSEKLQAKYKLPGAADSAIANESVNARETETLQIIKNINDDDELSRLVEQMQGSNRLGPSMILGASSLRKH